MTHPICAAEAPNSALMSGRTTLTIEPVITETKTAEATTARKSRVDTGSIALPPALIVLPRQASLPLPPEAC
jgi:hypothetical protein